MIIRIKNLRCKTIIGVYESEKKQKQTLVINIKIKYDAGNSPKTDNINDTLNYHTLVEKVKNHVESHKFELVERVVEEVGQLVMSYDKVRACKVEIDKTEGPIDFIDSFSVFKSFDRNPHKHGGGKDDE